MGNNESQTDTTPSSDKKLSPSLRNSASSKPGNIIMLYNIHLLLHIKYVQFIVRSCYVLDETTKVTDVEGIILDHVVNYIKWIFSPFFTFSLLEFY